jgi:hypothetical protein
MHNFLFLVLNVFWICKAILLEYSAGIGIRGTQYSNLYIINVRSMPMRDIIVEGGLVSVSEERLLVYQAQNPHASVESLIACKMG